MAGILDALLGLSIGGIQPEGATEKISPIMRARQKIMAGATQPDPGQVQPVHGDPAPIVPPEPAQPVNTTEVAPQIGPSETISAQEQAVNDASMDPKSVSDAYKSPPDLSQMYLDMMNKTIRQQQISSGMTLIAAGLAQDQNKGRLIDAAYGSGGPGGTGTGQNSMFNTVFDLQTKASELAQKNALRQRLPSIAKTHGISLEDAQVMFESGTLDQFLKEAASPDNEVFERADGSRALLNKKDGSVIREIGGAKPRATDYRDVGGGKKVLVYTDNGQPVNPEDKLPTSTEDTSVKWLDAPNGGKYATDSQGKRIPEKDIPGADQIEFKELGDGTIQPLNKTTGQPIGQPYGPKKDESTADRKNWIQAKMAAEARGEEFPDWDTWLKELERKRDPKAPSGNLDPKTGIEYPNPPTDMTYARNKDGSFVIDPATNSPKVVPMSGTKLATERTAEAEKVAGTAKTKKTTSNIMTAKADEAIGILGEDAWGTPVTGITGALFGAAPGSRRRDLEAALDTVKANLAFDKLQEMRANSPTGGALGNVSDTELKLLASTFASMDVNQSPEALKANLTLIRDFMAGDEDAIDKFRREYVDKNVKTSGGDPEADRKRKLDEALKKYPKRK